MKIQKDNIKLLVKPFNPWFMYLTICENIIPYKSYDKSYKNILVVTRQLVRINIRQLYSYTRL